MLTLHVNNRCILKFTTSWLKLDVRFRRHNIRNYKTYCMRKSHQQCRCAHLNFIKEISVERSSHFHSQQPPTYVLASARVPASNSSFIYYTVLSLPVGWQLHNVPLSCWCGRSYLISFGDLVVFYEKRMGLISVFIPTATSTTGGPLCTQNTHHVTAAAARRNQRTTFHYVRDGKIVRLCASLELHDDLPQRRNSEWTF